jgi:hypothetical protein
VHLTGDDALTGDDSLTGDSTLIKWHMHYLMFNQDIQNISLSKIKKKAYTKEDQQLQHHNRGKLCMYGNNIARNLIYVVYFKHPPP